MPDIDTNPRIEEEELDGDRRSTFSGQVETYHRWMRLKRLALVAFFVMAAAFLIWTVPWLPSGLETDDYTSELGFTAYLLGSVAISAVLSLLFEELTRRQRERLMVWDAVYDEGTGLHSRTYLYDRLSLECERAKRTGSTFSVFVLQMHIGGSAAEPSPKLSNAALRKMMALINSVTHRTDLVALLSGSALAVVAVGVDRAARSDLVERLQATVEAELPRRLDKPAPAYVRSGAATYGEDGKDASALVRAAQAAARLALPHHSQVA